MPIIDFRTLVFRQKTPKMRLFENMFLVLIVSKFLNSYQSNNSNNLVIRFIRIEYLNKNFFCVVDKFCSFFLLPLY